MNIGQQQNVGQGKSYWLSGPYTYLRQYCHDTDVFLLQETWLSDCTCSVLDNFHNDFAVFHTSAMEEKISNNIMFDIDPLVILQLWYVEASSINAVV